MNKHRLLIVVVLLGVAMYVVFSLGTILAKPAPNVAVDSGYALYSDDHGHCIRPDSDALDGLIKWRNGPNKWSLDTPMGWGESRGGHAASGW